MTSELTFVWPMQAGRNRMSLVASSKAEKPDRAFACGMGPQEPGWGMMSTGSHPVGPFRG